MMYRLSGLLCEATSDFVNDFDMVVLGERADANESERERECRREKEGETRRQDGGGAVIEEEDAVPRSLLDFG